MTRRDEGPTPPRRYTMKLMIDAATPPPVVGRSNELCMDFDATFHSTDQTYEANPGDSFSVEAYVYLPGTKGSEPLPELSVLGVNMVSWTSPRQTRISALTGETRSNPRIFDSMFRNDADRPDRHILARGWAVFAPDGELDGARDDAHARCQLCGKEYGGPAVTVVRYRMTSPSRLFLDRQGLFGFLVSLNTESDGQVVPWILDPELDVGGTYPPDDGDGPLPAS